MLLLQITSRRTGGGVTDFAAQLQHCWQKEGIRCATFSVDRSSPPSTYLKGLVEEQSVAILLHFSGYEYARRGLCRWLVSDLARALHSMPNLRLMTFFHEVFASGPPWRTAFWTAAEQKRIATDLLRLSRSARTNGELQWRWLAAKASPTCVLAMVPTFSTVGELDNPGPASSRPEQAVVFGSPPVRRRALSHPELRLKMHALGIDRLIEVGSEPSVADGPLPVDFRGRLPAPELSGLLARTRYGLVAYPPSHMEKSSVLAAYAAHGCVPILVSETRERSHLLTEGRHYIHIAAPVLNGDTADVIGREIYAWYQSHRLQTQAAELRDSLLSL